MKEDSSSPATHVTLFTRPLLTFLMSSLLAGDALSSLLMIVVVKVTFLLTVAATLLLHH